jgi:hypothetical protein
MLLIAAVLYGQPAARSFTVLYDNNHVNLHHRNNGRIVESSCQFLMQSKNTSFQKIPRKAIVESQHLLRSIDTGYLSSSESSNNDRTQPPVYSMNSENAPFLENVDDKYCNDLNARSMFGTKAYWDDVYDGRGDFPADTYSWYTDWNELQRYIKPYASTAQKRITTTGHTQCIFIPGIGNDSLLIDMISAGYNQHHNLVAQDYSHRAIERQIELLQSIGCSNYKYCREDNNSSSANTRSNQAAIADVVDPSNDTKQIDLYCCDITKKLPSTWNRSFDIIIEKGLLDAVYLSDDTNQNVQGATHNLYQILKSNGILISISSVIPNELRHILFPSPPMDDDTPLWEWIRDGNADATKAGCFIFQKIQ